MECAKCGTLLTAVNPDYMRRRNDFPSYIDAMLIQFHGGYGMYYDGALEALLCVNCIDELIDNNPWLRSLFQM